MNVMQSGASTQHQAFRSCPRQSAISAAELGTEYFSVTGKKSYHNIPIFIHAHALKTCTGERGSEGEW
jgi:hypothetical protein